MLVAVYLKRPLHRHVDRHTIRVKFPTSSRKRLAQSKNYRLVSLLAPLLNVPISICSSAILKYRFVPDHVHRI